MLNSKAVQAATCAMLSVVFAEGCNSLASAIGMLSLSESFTSSFCISFLVPTFTFFSPFNAAMPGAPGTNAATSVLSTALGVPMR